MIIIRFQALLLICKRNSKSNFKGLHFLTCCAPRGVGGVLRILSDGMIQGYFRFEMFDSGIFQLGWENLASIFWVVLLFKSWFFRVISVNAFSHPTSASGIIVLLKTLTKYWEVFPNLFVKQSIFSLFLNFEQKRTYSYHISRAWYNGSYTMMAKPIRALELHYPMIQFSILINVTSNSY